MLLGIAAVAAVLLIFDTSPLTRFERLYTSRLAAHGRQQAHQLEAAAQPLWQLERDGGQRARRGQPMRTELHALEEKIESDEQTMLHRLIDIRQSLWS